MDFKWPVVSEVDKSATFVELVNETFGAVIEYNDDVAITLHRKTGLAGFTEIDRLIQHNLTVSAKRLIYVAVIDPESCDKRRFTVSICR